MSTVNKLKMAEAITGVLNQRESDYYDTLTDDELLDYATVLWDYHTDLRDEWSRRQMMKSASDRDIL